MASKYDDDYGRITMTCNSCGEETTEYECCEDGEVVHYDDCDCYECIPAGLVTPEGSAE